MSQFTENFCVRIRPDRLVETTKEVRRDLTRKGNNEHIIIPKGYVWDGASIPKITQPLICLISISFAYKGGYWLSGCLVSLRLSYHVGSRYDFLAASLIHDFMYREKRVLVDCIDGSVVERSCTRAEADHEYRLCIIAFGHGRSTAYIHYTLVMLLGWLPWYRWIVLY